MRFDYDLAMVSAISDGGWYGVQPTGFGGDDAGLGAYDYQPQFGFASRPVDASRESDGTPVGCLMWRIDIGSTGGFAWLGHDTRYNAKCPPLSQGSCAQWNSHGAFSLLDTVTDTWTLYVPRSNGTKAHVWVAGQDSNGAEYMELRAASGAYLSFTSASNTLRHTGNAYVEVKPGELNLNGPVNAPTSLSVGGAGAQSLALYPQLSSYLTALETLLTAMATALDAKLVATPGANVGAVTAFIGAGAALKAAMQSQMIRGL